MVGQVQETMRKKGVRLIAVNDNYDSYYGEDDFLPFRNIVNEWYAKDTSKKIRSTFQAKVLNALLVKMLKEIMGMVEIDEQDFLDYLNRGEEELRARLDEERRKMEKTRDRLHRNNLRRKESGKLAEYEASYAAKRRARMLEMKAENPDTYGIPLEEYRTIMKQRKQEAEGLLAAD